VRRRATTCTVAPLRSAVSTSVASSASGDASSSQTHSRKRVRPSKGARQREVVLGEDFEFQLVEQVAQRTQREVIQVPRQVEMEPRRSRPASLKAREVGHRHHEPPPGLQDTPHLLEGPAGVVHVLENVPDDHLVEMLRRVAGVGESRSDADARARVGSPRGLGADLDAVDLEAAVGQRAQDHPAPTAHVQHARAGLQRAREKRDVSLPHQSNQALDERLELGAGLAVVFVRVEAANLLGVGLRIEAPEATAAAHHDGRGETFHLEAGSSLPAAADGTGRHGLHRLRGRRQRTNRGFVEFKGGQEQTSMARSSGAACVGRGERSRADGRGPGSR
jgi:hypothetical protein